MNNSDNSGGARFCQRSLSERHAEGGDLIRRNSKPQRPLRHGDAVTCSAPEEVSQVRESGLRRRTSNGVLPQARKRRAHVARGN